MDIIICSTYTEGVVCGQENRARRAQERMPLWALLLIAAVVMGGVLFFSVPMAHAAGMTYYVDARLGDNANNGLSMARPWKTLGRVSGAVLNPGDIVLFKRGDMWRESLDIAASGEQNNVISYGAYGDGSAPAFYGSVQLTQWASLGGGVWSASTTIASSSSLWLVRAGSAPLHLRPAVTSSALGEGEYVISPGEVKIRIAESYTGTPEVEASDRDTCIAGWGPKSYVNIQDIECSYFREAGVRSNDGTGTSSHWTVRSMSVHDISSPDENSGDGIIMSGNSSSLIQESSILRVAGHGVYLLSNKNSTSDITVENMTIRDSCGGGIAIARIGQEGASGKFTVRYTTIYDTYGESGIASCAAGSPVGIHVQGLEGGRVTGLAAYYNTIHDTLGTGIRLDGGYDGVQLFNNTIVDTRNRGTSCVALFGSDSSAQVVNTICDNKNNGMLAMADTARKEIDYNDWFRASSGPLFSVGEYGARDYKEYLVLDGYRRATGFDAHSTASNPMFIDAEKDNFYLRQFSPVIDKGRDIGFSRDFAGALVPQGRAPDLGAYEYSGAGPLFDQGQSFMDALQRIARRVSDILAVFGRWGLLEK